MAIVVIFSLVFSLVEGALILPAHIAHSKALKRGEKPNALMRGLDNMMAFLRDTIYTPVLKWAVKFNYPTLAICVAGLMITFGALRGGIIKGTFFPVIPRDNYTVNLKLPAGTREDLTLEILDRIERATNEVNEELSKEFFSDGVYPVTKMQKNVGPASYQGDITVSLLDGETRGDVSARTIIAKVREKLGRVDEAETLTFSSGSPFGRPII